MRHLRVFGDVLWWARRPGANPTRWSSAVSLIEGYLQLRYPTAVNASVIEPLKLMVVFVLKSLPPMKAR
jgi:hypothetical protein